MKKWIIFFLVLTFVLGSFNIVFSQEKLKIYFFYSKTCTHCAAEQEFLDQIEEKYPQIEVYRYLASANVDLLIVLAQKHNAERFIGSVPLTFVGDDFFAGFDSTEGIGKKIEESILRQIKEEPQEPSGDENKITLPFIGEIDVRDYSLLALSVIMGALDGFNVCSLGALVLILGLVLALRSRTKIFILGGIFILTTGIIYGLLIVLWYKFFETLSSFLRTMEILIGLLGIGGGIYFLRQFLKFRKQGPVCETPTGGIVSKFSSKIREVFQKPGNILGMIGALFLFAAIITVVEFPCSAVVPLFYAGVLADAHLPTFSYLSYIALFVFFYMLDEVIVFLIAVFKMTIWMASPKFITWMTLVEAIFLFSLGIYYLVGL
jgi:thiol-disulfide isomerase/thioredoxin